MKIVEVTELVQGADLFRSQGYSHIKVTKNGEPQVLRLPIQSSGVTEVIERLRKSEPKPPRAPITLSGDTPAGREHGLRKGEKKTITDFDYTDANYVALKERHDEDLAYHIIDVGLAVPIKDANGEPVTDVKKKIDILRGMGFSLPQFQQLVKDIQGLTELSDEDRASFFDASSPPAETPAS